MTQWREKWALLGPGLLYAGAAVGVSHLVQSTRAGAEYGFQLLWVVLLVNVIKYPVFEVGPRYAAATGTTLLDGYRAIGRWALWLYVVMSVLTMFSIMAAISVVTGGLFAQLTGLSTDPKVIASALLMLSTVILGFGHYSLLDRMMKAIILLLTISTIIALVLSASEPSEQQSAFMTAFDMHDHAHMLFLVALIGWMPAPVDISVWHSVWSVSKNKERGTRIPLSSAILDFNIGYWGTMVLAAAFLALGALVLYGTGSTLTSSSLDFCAHLIQLYTRNLGDWAFPFIALAAFTTMFSTLLTCLDAFPRTLRKSTKLLIDVPKNPRTHANLYWGWIILCAGGASVLLLYFASSLLQLVDFATRMSFVLAPVLAILNYIAINRPEVAPEMRQGRWLSRFNLLSIVLLSVFSIWYLFFV